MATNTGEGTKDVSQAQERTDAQLTDDVLIINSATKEVQRMKLDKLGESIAGNAAIAPADYDDFFGL